MKKRRKKTTKHKKGRYYSVFILLVVFLFLAFTTLFYLVEDKLSQNSTKIDNTSTTLQENSKQIKELQNLLKTKQDYTTNKYLSEIEDLNETLKSLEYKNVEENIKYKISRSTKPKLAIIIDDVTNSTQVKKIKNLPFTVTMSFLPPTQRFPYSSKVAKNLQNSMIHLPLEALNYTNQEPNTLLTTDSVETIRTRVKELKEKFPNARYTNNHTGSKFTSDYEAMKRLLYVLDEFGLEFVDSRTTPASRAVQAAEFYNKHIFVRDTFLDNNLEIGYIHNQLLSAVKKAKKNGYAIAICHPHSVTLQALNKAQSILKDVELVYINQI